MVTYHQGDRKRVENDLTNLYMFRDFISKNYDKLGPMEQESVLEDFSKRHRIDKKLINEHDARTALQEHFSKMTEPRLRAIYNSVMGPKPKSRKLKEKAEQFSLFGE